MGRRFLNPLKDAAKKIVFTVRDNFSTAIAAGSVHGTSAIVGPGTRTVVDTENKVSIGP